jgi:EmrB/QacA subfamily drug resistance transporter
MPTAPGHERRWLILAVLSLSLITIGLDAMIITMALPKIQVSMHASADQLQWTIDAYTLAFAGVLPLGGGLADRFGRKLVLLAGLLAFLGCSIGAALATGPGMLIAFRGGMGAGSALVMPTTLAIIKHVFPADEQSRAIGIWAAAAALGIPLGPVIGGLLLDRFWWGSIFLINVPILALLFAGVLGLVPESRDENHPGLDITGAVLSAGGLAVLVYGLIEAPSHGWASASTVASLTAGVLLLAGFAFWESASTHPMIPGALLRSRRIGGPAAAILCIAFPMYGGLFALTQYLQFTLGLGPLQAGVRLLASCSLVISAPLAPRLVERAGLKPVVTAGLALSAAAAFLLAGAQLASDTRVVWGLAVLGVGIGLTIPPSADSILAAAPPGRSGAGSALTDIAMQVGGSLGVAVMGSVLATTYSNALPSLGGLPPPARLAVRNSVGGAAAVARHLGPAGRLLLNSADHAFLSGLSNAMLAGAAVSAAGAVLAAVVLPGARRGHGAAGAQAAPAAADDARPGGPRPPGGTTVQH